MRISLAALAACGALVAYFGYFALYGSHGIVRYVELSHAVTLKSAELAAIEAERSALERRVSMLRTESIDPDLLEERARDSLGLTEPGEVVILRPKS